MSNINPNCDSSHCRHGYKEVRKYPSSGGGLYLCLPCFARHMRGKQTGRPEDCPQVSWSTAEVIFDKHGEPFDAEAAVLPFGVGWPKRSPALTLPEQEHARKEVKTKQKLTVWSGPNNPVSLVWIDLAAPSYGIHGTPQPEEIGKTESDGCIRPTNWDAVDRISRNGSPGNHGEI